ncbi:NAD(P)H-hydrate dehydratase [Robiginitalea sediminis]|uniref:NAD(P)H-hydrate dehydratase n=1 Tax=Robiginitalea sediminis TaxID=1982593 RepID=UPI000B4C0E08|nr:NAD(P)H-hydrate dehydratase [Robiginitalea sediminis]
MKILNREQIYQADQVTQQIQGISSTELMERAATAAFGWLHERLQGAPVPVRLFCGIGNNGGDGLVMARHLAEHGYHIEVYIVNYSDARSEDFLINLESLKDRKIWPQTLSEESPLPEIAPTDILVDAIFGIGLSRPPAPWVRTLIGHLNASGAFILSVDMPSGLPMDRLPEYPEGVIRAGNTLTFGTPKLPFLLPETGGYTRGWEVLDIGLDPGYLQSVPAPFSLVGMAQARVLLRERDRFSHKGTYGHVMVVGGSYGKIGAVVLAARAALRSGAGLISAWVPECGVLPLQSGSPEIMVQAGSGKEQLLSFPTGPEDFALAVGMGMGQDPETEQVLIPWLASLGKPVVLDADALNLLSRHPEALKTLPEGCLLTPHPGELRRLLGPWKDDYEKLDKAAAFAREHKCVLLVKGAYTAILTPAGGFINTTGNPGMATAGSGDVLAGILAGLLAQGYTTLQASILGVYLHGLAGDIGMQQTGMEALTAGDLIRYIGQAYGYLRSEGRSQQGERGDGAPEKE